MWSLFLGGVTPAHDQRDLAEHADRLGEMLNGRDCGIGITASSGKRPSGHPYHCDTGDKECRKLAFAAPGTFGVCAPAPLRRDSARRASAFVFRSTIQKNRPLRGGVSR